VLWRSIGRGLSKPKKIIRAISSFYFISTRDEDGVPSVEIEKKGKGD